MILVSLTNFEICTFLASIWTFLKLYILSCHDMGGMTLKVYLRTHCIRFCTFQNLILHHLKLIWCVFFIWIMFALGHVLNVFQKFPFCVNRAWIGVQNWWQLSQTDLRILKSANPGMQQEKPTRPMKSLQKKFSLHLFDVSKLEVTFSNTFLFEFVIEISPAFQCSHIHFFNTINFAQMEERNGGWNPWIGWSFFPFRTFSCFRLRPTLCMKPAAVSTKAFLLGNPTGKNF